MNESHPPPDPGNRSADAGASAASEKQQHGSRKHTPEAPEHRNERRRFLIWALMIGAAPPERVTQRVIAELEQEAP